MTRLAGPRSVRLVVAAFIGSLGLLSACSQSAAECQTEQKCDELGNKTVAQCTTDGDNCYNKLKQGNASCVRLADATLEFNNCAAGLSCSERKITALNNGTCGNQWSALLGAATSAIGAGCPSCRSNADGGS